MYSCYSLLPMLIFTPLLIIVSNFASLDEQTLFSLIQTLMFMWVGFLLFCGTSVVHQYLALRTVLTIFGIIIAIGIIIFLALLGVTIVQQILEFILLMAEEIGLRT